MDTQEERDLKMTIDAFKKLTPDEQTKVLAKGKVGYRVVTQINKKTRCFVTRWYFTISGIPMQPLNRKSFLFKTKEGAKKAANLIKKKLQAQAKTLQGN